MLKMLDLGRVATDSARSESFLAETNSFGLSSTRVEESRRSSIDSPQNGSGL